MSSVYEDVTVTVLGDATPTLPLFSFLKNIFRAHRTYFFDAKFTDKNYSLSDDNKTANRHGGGYTGMFAFVDATLEQLTVPLYIKFSSCKSYFGVGAGVPERVINTGDWNYGTDDSQGSFILGWDTWVRPESVYKDIQAQKLNTFRIRDETPIKMTYENGKMCVASGEVSLSITVPCTHRPCVVIFTDGITPTIIGQMEYGMMEKTRKENSKKD
jgi:hypothetical protein